MTSPAPVSPARKRRSWGLLLLVLAFIGFAIGFALRPYQTGLADAMTSDEVQARMSVASPAERAHVQGQVNTLSVVVWGAFLVGGTAAIAGLWLVVTQPKIRNPAIQEGA